MSGRLAGKTAVVTAAAQGIGRATALAFAAEGAAVWATDIDRAGLDALRQATDRPIRTDRLDVTDKAAIAALARECGAIDVLFNCAGIVHHGTVMDATDQEFDTAVALNVRSMMWTIQAFLPAMLEAGGGSIVNIASVASSIKGASHRALYGMTKGAVIGLTKAVAADYVGQGVRCNAICPGTVQTPSLDQRIADQARRIDPRDDSAAVDRARQAFIDRQPMGRLGTAEEIAHLAVYLAGEESAFVTGTTMVIDGGWSA